MNRIFGYEKEKSELAVICSMLKNAADYHEKGLRIPRGVLLSGKPGVGKTVLAKSMAADGINLVELRAATCCESEAAGAVKRVFKKAKATAPCVLLLDELDKIAGFAESFFMEDNDKVRKTLLQELDDLAETDEILVVATCNDECCISSELIRPGRFDRRIEIPTPDEATRRLILKEYFSKIKAEKRFDLDLLAKNTRDFSGAKLECLANESGIAALTDNRDYITEDDLRFVINKLEFGATEKAPLADSAMLSRIAVHEAGHALAAIYLCPDCLFGASVLPQGDSNGHIRFIPDEDKVQTVSEMENETAVLLAGHVAERIKFGEHLLGSAEDIQKATMRMHYLCSREAAYGYDTVLSGLQFGRHDLSGEVIKMKLARKIEERLVSLDAKIEQLIKEHSDVFAAICKELEAKWVLTREELFEIKEKSTVQNAACS